MYKTDWLLQSCLNSQWRWGWVQSVASLAQLYLSIASFRLLEVPWGSTLKSWQKWTLENAWWPPRSHPLYPILLSLQIPYPLTCFPEFFLFQGDRQRLGCRHLMHNLTLDILFSSLELACPWLYSRRSQASKWNAWCVLRCLARNSVRVIGLKWL